MWGPILNLSELLIKWLKHPSSYPVIKCSVFFLYMRYVVINFFIFVLRKWLSVAVWIIYEVKCGLSREKYQSRFCSRRQEASGDQYWKTWWLQVLYFITVNGWKSADLLTMLWLLPVLAQNKTTFCCVSFSVSKSAVVAWRRDSYPLLLWVHVTDAKVVSLQQVVMVAHMVQQELSFGFSLQRHNIF